MKKIVVLVLALAGQAALWAGYASVPQVAVTENDTLIVIKHPEKVTIQKGKDRFGIEIEGREGESDFRYSHKMEVASNSSVITEEQNPNWDFKIPFLNKKEKKRSTNEIRFGSFGFGWVNAVNVAEGLNVDMGSSYELMIDHLLSWKYDPWYSGTSFSIGFGLNWKNYRMTGGTRFIKEGAKIVLGDYPEGADIKFSRIKVFSLTVPLMVSQVLSRKISLSVGPVVNFNTHASMKTRYTLNGKKEKLTDNNIHQNRVTVDLMALLNIKSVGLYVKYSPTNVLDTEYGPKFKSLSTGLTLFY